MILNSAHVSGQHMILDKYSSRFLVYQEPMFRVSKIWIQTRSRVIIHFPKNIRPCVFGLIAVMIYRTAYVPLNIYCSSKNHVRKHRRIRFLYNIVLRHRQPVFVWWKIRMDQTRLNSSRGRRYGYLRRRWPLQEGMTRKLFRKSSGI